ncbi:Sodium/glucose cotransporter 2 [Armadillidium nasatum]|uniref:Sodium/glucose cotransporter 2 n=1 Tax=Armadillidium nasatum TaxID=96803 RepID=A0A5N5TLU4_9CRUS|nr:Sodium/glucose cotransporter 2 [Armadillidium nasatum]
MELSTMSIVHVITIQVPFQKIPFQRLIASEMFIRICDTLQYWVSFEMVEYSFYDNLKFQGKEERQFVMQLEVSSNIGIVDYCFFGAMLILSGAIGLYTSFVGNKSPEEFLMGNRSFRPLPVAMSVLTSFVSSISLLGFSGEAYAYGTQISIFVLGSVFAIIFVIHVSLPILYPLKLTSVNEYIELRFKSDNLRLVISLLTFVKVILYMGVCLYAPTIALVSVTKLNTLTYIFLLGVVCTIYSAFGGIRAVIWTDVFQLTVMLIGLVLVITIGCIQNGGLIKVLYIASEGGRLDMFNMSLSPFVRHTFLNSFVFGFFFCLHVFGSDQVYVQRACSVKSHSNAKRFNSLRSIRGMRSNGPWHNQRTGTDNALFPIIIGSIMIGLAVVASYGESIIDISNTIGATFNGPILGVFLIGYFLPKCNLKGVWTGFIVSSAFTIWIAMGATFYKELPDLLPFSADKCENVNFTSITNSSFVEEFTMLKNETEDSTDDSYISRKDMIPIQ